MAAADQIKSLIKSYAEDDEHRFFATAMQIAASEARQGHTTVAQELKQIIEKARKEKSVAFLDAPKTVSFSAPKRELKELIEVFKPRIDLKDMVLAASVKESLDKLINERKNGKFLKNTIYRPKENCY